jgi:hypothetical protein
VRLEVDERRGLSNLQSKSSFSGYKFEISYTILKLVEVLILAESLPTGSNSDHVHVLCANLEGTRVTILRPSKYLPITSSRSAEIDLELRCSVPQAGRCRESRR